MTAAPRTLHPSPRARVPHGQSAAALVAQLEAMFGDDEGWIEAWHGHADPSNTARITLDKDQANRWHWYSRARRPELVRLLLGWGTRYGNAYISTSLYSRPDRDVAWALPSRVLFVDDAPEHAPLPYSMALETSPGNWQAVYLLHTPVDAATRQDLQRRIAYALGADKSGADIEQLGRVAGTWNTKRGTQHPVTLTYADGPRYSVDELAAQYPPVAPGAGGTINTSGDRPLAVIDWGKVDQWLGNLDDLLTPEGMPRRVQHHPCSQVYKILTGKQAWPKADSAANDPSRMRYHVAIGLYRFFHYPVEPLTAMLLHWGNFEHLGAESGKGTREIRTDIAAILAKAARDYPDVKPTPIGTKPTKPAHPPPEVPHKSRGRPRTQPIDSFYQALCDDADCGKVMQTQGQIAARYGVTEQTIRRWEKALAGKVKRHRTADKQASWLEIVRPIINTEAAEREGAAAADVLPEVLSKIAAGNIDARTYESNTPPPEQTPAAPSLAPSPATFPALADAMREAFAAYWDAGRITQRRIAGYLEANYPGAPWSDAALCYWYGKLLAERQRDRSREKLLADLPSMPHAKLRRLDRRCDRLLADGPDGPHGKQYHFARWAAPHVADELASDRRRAALERTRTGRNRRPVPVPKLPLLALVDVPQDAPSEADGLEPPWMAGTPMDAPAAVPLVETPYQEGNPMPAAVATTPGTSPAACVPPIPAGPTAPAIEPVEPRPAAAATHSQTIVRPDLYKRLAAQRRAAAVPA